MTRLCKEYKLSGWRQSSFALMRLKVFLRKAQQTKRSRKSDANEKVEKAHRAYLEKARHYLDSSIESTRQLEGEGVQLTPVNFSALQEKLFQINTFQERASRQIDQIDRRVLKKETIGFSQNAFS